MESSPSRHKLLCIIDRNVSRHHSDLVPSIQRYALVHGESIHLVCSPLLVPGGEAVKTEPVHVTAIHEAMNIFP